jgi:hypothetical protein
MALHTNLFGEIETPPINRKRATTTTTNNATTENNKNAKAVIGVKNFLGSFSFGIIKNLKDSLLVLFKHT